MNLRLPTEFTDAATKDYVDTSINRNLTNYLKLDGSTPMTGNLNMNSNKITSITDPTSNTDCATKNYVDINTGNYNSLIPAMTSIIIQQQLD